MNKLFLIPNAISEGGSELGGYATCAGSLNSLIAHVRIFFVEDPKSARRLLKLVYPDFPLPQCRFLDLNEHTKTTQIKEYVKLLKEGDSGLISEAGCPCIADPGADLVLLAHQNNVQVVPLVGPSSILLALMASGLGGQNFAFNGYLPREGNQRIAKIKALEKRAAQECQTQIFMETPYRNQKLWEDIVANCESKTHLCVAMDLTGVQEMVKTQTIAAWRNTGQRLLKQPCLFILR